jgi:hypothetical protein
VKDIIEQARIKLNIDLLPENIRISDDINKFGTFYINIDEYFSEKYKKKFNFRLKVVVKRAP